MRAALVLGLAACATDPLTDSTAGDLDVRAAGNPACICEFVPAADDVSLGWCLVGPPGGDVFAYQSAAGETACQSNCQAIADATLTRPAGQQCASWSWADIAACPSTDAFAQAGEGGSAAPASFCPALFGD
jgi:hypothetical protein